VPTKKRDLKPVSDFLGGCSRSRSGRGEREEISPLELLDKGPRIERNRDPRWRGCDGEGHTAARLGEKEPLLDRGLS
jgi:hypothetical protein